MKLLEIKKGYNNDMQRKRKLWTIIEKKASFKKNIYIFMRPRERRRDTTSRGRSREPEAGLNPGSQDHALSQRQTHTNAEPPRRPEKKALELDIVCACLLIQ